MYDPNWASKAACGWALIFTLAALLGAFFSIEYAWLVMAAAAINVGIAFAMRGAGSISDRGGK